MNTTGSFGDPEAAAHSTPSAESDDPSGSGPSPPPDFRNDPLDVAALPQLDEDHYQALHPAYRTVRVLTTVSGWLGVTVVTILAAQLAPAPAWVETLAIITALVLTVGATVLVWVEYAYRGWTLREHDVSFRRGFLSRSVTTVPFSRVQHVSVSAGAIERAFRLASLEIFTAGSGSADLVVPGLSPATAERTREMVLSRTRLDG